MAEGHRPVIHYWQAISEIHAGAFRKEGPHILMSPRLAEIPFRRIFLIELISATF